MTNKHYTIPVFIPEVACPSRCVFCNQRAIAHTLSPPTLTDARRIIEERLATIPRENRVIDIAFFGGNFTGIPRDEQRAYLALANEYRIRGDVNGIRLSTRPDYITEDALSLLRDEGVTTIEIGAQSTDDEVLRNAKRGHTRDDIIRAANMIREWGFRLGIQMMIGLPRDTREKAETTAETIINLGAACTRIYPLLVIRNTELARAYHAGMYTPLALDEAVAISASLITRFERANVPVIRVGLHPSEGFTKGNLIAGPFHPAFRLLVETRLWGNALAPLLQGEGDALAISVNPKEVNACAGYKGVNKHRLQTRYRRVRIYGDARYRGRVFNARVS